MVQRTCRVPDVVGLSAALGTPPRARYLPGPVPFAGDHDRRVRADIHLVGGAAMLLAYGERPATRDLDGTWER